ncbi:protein of unknown function [Candidatus Filomicrobium marinum]|uniref:Uncharacterized protein n=1 Tax=Candidatus Filomicrobium marinum TaxID=1608628 RepID=A0A0D6JGU4_9HYPH|nr:hypothetical protein [Candidatus Filomicrobium marinum]CFX47320.1 protein of unknown function [Candidatus Filomicrobium marinum]CPR20547.1 protein of unknown function [Candidatus Filomicrobium marinum]
MIGSAAAFAFPGFDLIDDRLQVARKLAKGGLAAFTEDSNCAWVFEAISVAGKNGVALMPELLTGQSRVIVLATISIIASLA